MQTIFQVFDSKAETYHQPFFAQATGAGLRSFSAACNNPEHDFNRYPADFTLFEIGTYDTQTGDITTYPAKKSMGLALDFIDESAPQTLVEPTPTTNIMGAR